MRQYERIIDVPDISANDLFIKTNTWFVETFVSSSDVIEFRDKEHGKIAGKYTLNVDGSLYFYNIRQTVIVDMKANKVKINIREPYFSITGDKVGSRYSLGNYIPLNEQGSVRPDIKKVRQKWENLAESLASYLLNNNTEW